LLRNVLQDLILPDQYEGFVRCLCDENEAESRGKFSRAQSIYWQAIRVAITRMSAPQASIVLITATQPVPRGHLHRRKNRQYRRKCYHYASFARNPTGPAAMKLRAANA